MQVVPSPEQSWQALVVHPEQLALALRKNPLSQVVQVVEFEQATQFNEQVHAHFVPSAFKLNPGAQAPHRVLLFAFGRIQPEMRFLIQVPLALAVGKNIGGMQVAQLLGPMLAVQVSQGNKH